MEAVWVGYTAAGLELASAPAVGVEDTAVGFAVGVEDTPVGFGDTV